MPKVVEGSSYRKNYDEKTISRALEDILNNGLSKKAASRKYGIPRSTLQFRLSEKFTKSTFGPSPILSVDEEKMLVDWVFHSHKKGFPRRKEDLQISIKSFLDEKPRDNPFRDNMPGDGWYKAFLKRHPTLCERVPESVTAASGRVSEADIRKWFLNIETYLKEENYFDILNFPDRVFNADETCFMLCPKNKTILAPRGARNVYEIDNAPAKSNLTVLFTFSAKGDITPPFIIYPYKRVPSAIASSVPDTWGVGTSSNGWMKAELFFEYIGNVFHPFLVKKCTQFPVILYVDGHSTHNSYQLSVLCSQLKIILICLYANSTRILQPADVSAFKPLKSYWKKGVLEWRRKHISEALSQEKFAPILQKVIDTYIRPDIIQHGFICTGLCPWNPNAIDYSKCLGKNNTGQNIKNDDEVMIPRTRFEEIVGVNLMNRLKVSNAKTKQESQEFWVLHRLWKEFDSSSMENEIETEIIDSACTNAINEELFNIADMPIIFASTSKLPIEEELAPTSAATGKFCFITLLGRYYFLCMQVL